MSPAVLGSLLTMILAFVIPDVDGHPPCNLADFGPRPSADVLHEDSTLGVCGIRWHEERMGNCIGCNGPFNEAQYVLEWRSAGAQPQPLHIGCANSFSALQGKDDITLQSLKQLETKVSRGQDAVLQAAVSQLRRDFEDLLEPLPLPLPVSCPLDTQLDTQTTMPEKKKRRVGVLRCLQEYA